MERLFSSFGFLQHTAQRAQVCLTLSFYFFGFTRHCDTVPFIIRQNHSINFLQIPNKGPFKKNNNDKWEDNHDLTSMFLQVMSARLLPSPSRLRSSSLGPAERKNHHPVGSGKGYNKFSKPNHTRFVFPSSRQWNALFFHYYIFSVH